MTTRHSILAALLLAASLAACSGGGSSDDSAAGSRSLTSDQGAMKEDRAASEPAAGETGGSGADSAGDRTAARVLPADRDVVYRGAITVRVSDVGRAADRAEALATGVDGVVFSEQTTTDPRNRRFGQASLTLRVPPTAFGPTLEALGRLGKELDRTRSAEDVTTQVTDVDSRVRSQQRSVDRVRVLLSRAETIGEVVQVEAELSRREADLESLEAQLARLKDVTDLATIEVTLLSPDRAPTGPTKDEDDLGFLSGLRGGWDAFVAIVLVTLTVLGALVPFGVTAAVVGVPLLMLWRSRRRPAPVPPAAADV
jgi:hypothetical protein